MTLLGKVFTGIIFVLSVLFFALSVGVNASHQNQKERATTLEARAKDAEAKNNQLGLLLEETKNDLAIEQLARRSALAALQTQLESLETELESQSANYNNLLAAHTELTSSERATQEELKARTSDNENLRVKIVEVRENLNQVFADYVSTKDQMNRLQGAKESLEDREAQLAELYTKAKEQLTILGINEDTLLDAPPAVNGQVLAVDTSGFVELSLGRDDGLREGFTLEVSRSGQYVGRVKIRTVRGDKSTAEILPGYQRGRILRGDRVDSKLY